MPGLGRVHGERRGYPWAVAIGGNSAYAGSGPLPPLVSSAVAVAANIGFDNSCAPEQGRLLSVLARGRSGGRVGETGTGCGVGLAWMIDAADDSTSFVSIEINSDRARLSGELFGDYPRVQVLQGDWTGLLAHGPFDLLVLDGGGKGKPPAIESPIDPAAGWLAMGGTIVLDDFIPAGSPGAGEHDAARDHWLNHPLLRAIEIQLSPSLATIVGTRVR
jgi:predicted O-methyltransferase YrrM